MPALPNLPVQVPPQLNLPGDLQALASGAVPGAPAATTPGTPSHAPASPPSLLSALP